MNPNWKKAKWDVVPKEDLAAWYACEEAIAQKPILTFFHNLPTVELPELTPEQLALIFNDDSWGDAQEIEFAGMTSPFMNVMSEICSWDLTDFIEMDMLCDRIRESSLNQVIDEDVDFSGDPKMFLI